MLQTQGKMKKKWSSGVDTGSSSVDTRPSSQRTQSTGSSGVDTGSCSIDIGSSSVDTRPSSQRTQSTGLDSVSTQPEVVSTLETLLREPFVPVWDSVLTHPMGMSTHSGNLFTLSHIWTHGSLGIMWIGLGACAHDPQGYFWTHWAINTLQLAIQLKRTFQSLPEIGIRKIMRV
ncbi:hypothetical protein Taro_010935, partial [Colocasia esculenta]|nr:hypothetical protein [Colocasia esculenta]